MSDLCATLLARISESLHERGIAHGDLERGPATLNANAGDGQSVFVKIARRGASPRRLASELVGAAWARTQGFEAPESVFHEVLSVRDDHGSRRYTTAWHWIDMVAEPADLVAAADAALAAMARTASVPPPPMARPVSVDDLMDDLVGRLVGRDGETWERIKNTALQTWTPARDGVEMAPRVWVHGDLHLDNVGWLDGDTPVLLDWEGHGLGPVEWDVAQMVRTLFVHRRQASSSVRDRALTRVMERAEEHFAVDWGLVETLIRFRSACSASFLAASGGHEEALAADLALLDCDLEALDSTLLAA